MCGVTAQSHIRNLTSALPKTFNHIDLRALKLAAVIDIYRLPLRKNIQHLRAGLAMTVAGSLSAPKWQVHFCANSRRIDVKDAGVHIIHRPKCLVNVAGINRGRQTVTNAVCDLDCVVQRLCWNYGRYRSEDFFLRDAHVRRNIRKHSRLDEVATSMIAAS